MPNANRVVGLSCLQVSRLTMLMLCGAVCVQAQQEQPDSLGNPLGANANLTATSPTGTFSQSIPIAVPAFRGLEPRLALVYSSGGGNGFAGVGWNLSGFSMIQRAKPGRGTPRYDANDIFLLDGAELVPCVVGMGGASCTAGGTHTTKTESYLKIKKDVPSTDKWTVWGRDGTRTEFEPVFTVTSGAAFRYGQKKVIDTNNNEVTYAWTCVDDAPGTPGLQVQDCYPDSVSYGPYQVKLYREARPDKLSFAVGDAGRLGKTNFRLLSILVSYNGSPVRAYQLTYLAGGSPLTARSLLQSVSQHGKLVNIDSAGVITGQSPLPARQFTYQPDTNGASFVTWPN